MLSVTVSWNLYIPDVRLDTTIWSSKLVFYKAWKNSGHLKEYQMQDYKQFKEYFEIPNWTLTQNCGEIRFA